MDALGKHMVCCASIVALGRKSQVPPGAAGAMPGLPLSGKFRCRRLDHIDRKNFATG